MLLLVDANILISMLISRGLKQKLFFSKDIESKSPDRILFEIGKHWKELADKSGLSEKDLELEFTAIRLQLTTFSLNNFSNLLKKGTETSPDPDDSEYFALALKLNCPIWSEDKELKKQDKVRVFNTKELSDLIEFKKKSIQEDKDKSDSEDE